MTFPELCKRMGLPEPITEYKFHPDRMWRFDFCWPEYKLYLECDGGIWSGGRHVSPQGYMDDMKKGNEATILGWRPLRLTPKSLISPLAVQLVKDAMESCGKVP